MKLDVKFSENKQTFALKFGETQVFPLSSVVAITEIDGGYRITVKDARGEQSIDILNGEDGLTPYIGENGNWWIGEKDLGVRASGGSGGTSFTTDETLILENGVLKVNTANEVAADNTLPVTSAAVHEQLGNIEALLATI